MVGGPSIVFQMCGWRNFYPQINEFVKVICRHRRKPTLTLFEVSTNAYWIVYKVKLWHWGTMTKDSRLDRTKHALSKIWSFLIFNQLVRIARLKAMWKLADKRRLTASVLMVFCSQFYTVFEAISCFFHYCLCQEARPSLTDNEIMRRTKKREQDQMRKEYIQQKGYKTFEMWECKWWELNRIDPTVKKSSSSNFPPSTTFQRRLAHARD